jgi:uncharacterized protein (DUF58 family)
MTARGWWCVFTISLVLLVGALAGLSALVVPALALLLWFGWEWLLFALRARTVARRLFVERQLYDARGPVAALWAGRAFEVRAALRLRGPGQLPYAVVSDLVPFGVEHAQGPTVAEGAVDAGHAIELTYTVRCPGAGLARFEGLRVELADLQGFFYRALFVRAPLVLRILPAPAAAARGRPPALKRHNQLLPPGIHRLRQAGSSSELLDLRDYQPGDPPRTIAWKVSARRDRLITKDFESEVPVRCTLFLDTSNSVRVPSPHAERPDQRQAGPATRRPTVHLGAKPLDRLVELAEGALQANKAVRDLTGLVLFDEHGARALRPGRTGTHHDEIVRALAEAAGLAPAVGRADPDPLLPMAYALAEEVYPDLLRPEVNALPGWLTWFLAFPRYRRRWRGLLEYLHRTKLLWLYLGTTGAPGGLLALNVVALFLGWLPDWALGALFQALLVLSPLAVNAAWLLFLLSLVVSRRQRRLARWRKRLAALLAVRYGPLEGGLAALLEDDDLFSAFQQRFLAEHQVPYSVSLYDEQGRYLLTAPEKVPVLARALLEAVGRGHDNELFVLLADLLELDDHLGPPATGPERRDGPVAGAPGLLQAVRVALSRHHQVLVVCAWPAGLPPPGAAPRRRSGPGAPLHRLLTEAATARAHAAYARLCRAFARLGATVVCAGGDEPVALILDRMDRLRAGARRR